MLQPEKPLLNRADDAVDSIADLIPSPADTFKTLVDFRRRQYQVIVFALSVALGLGLIYILTTPPSYTATASVIIDTNKMQLFGQQSIFSEMPLELGDGGKPGRDLQVREHRPGRHQEVQSYQ